MDEKERFLAVLRRSPVDRPPCICPMQTGTLELMAASGAFWPEAHADPRVMARLASAAHEHGGLESVRVPFEASVDASAFGALTSDQKLRRRPMILSERVPRREDFEGMDVPEPRRQGRAPVVLEAIRSLRSRAPNLPVICGIVSPHMLGFQLIGDQTALMDMYHDPIFLKAVMLKAKAFAVAYAEAAYEAGADVIAMVDSFASGDFLTASEYQEFALPYQAKVCKEAGKLGIPLVLHICGDTTDILHLMAQSGANGISIDHEVPILRAKALAKGTAVLGNISPTTLLLKGGTEEVADYVDLCIREGVDAVSPGCGLALQTPTRNLQAMAQATKRAIAPRG
ncbi:MAG: MtaA/CmuA family methyltransferase [Methanomassiliicoccales archaeon]|jgi:MtaA/CmuA family methyltransferase|nr:MtaA/CmuA family methyltransferase [Methanomassiliicoccales archaeon]